MIFDSLRYYKGVIAYIRVFDGSIEPGTIIKMMSTGAQYEVIEVGTLNPGFNPCNQLSAGEVGYISGSIKNVRDVHRTPLRMLKSPDQALPGIAK